MKPITKLINGLREYRDHGTIYEYHICDIKNLVIDYMNETQDFSFDDYLNEFEDYDYVEDYVKNELERGGLERLRYCLNDCYLDCDYYRINAYGNLENITTEDIENRVDEMIEHAEDVKKQK